MDRSVRSLHFAVRPRAFVKHVAQLFVPLAALTLVPLVVSVAGGQLRTGLYYLAVALFLVAVGIPCSRIRLPGAIQTNEAMVVTALTFLLAGLVMSFPSRHHR